MVREYMMYPEGHTFNLPWWPYPCWNVPCKILTPLPALGPACWPHWWNAYITSWFLWGIYMQIKTFFITLCNVTGLYVQIQSGQSYVSQYSAVFIEIQFVGCWDTVSLVLCLILRYVLITSVIVSVPYVTALPVNGKLLFLYSICTVICKEWFVTHKALAMHVCSFPNISELFIYLFTYSDRFPWYFMALFMFHEYIPQNVRWLLISIMNRAEAPWHNNMLISIMSAYVK